MIAPVYAPQDPDWEARCREAFHAQGMMKTLAAEIVALEPGRVALRAPIRPEVSQHHGFAHAALAFALGDNAQGFSAQTLLPPGPLILTVEMKISLVAPAVGEWLIAEARVERPGRTITATAADVYVADSAVGRGERKRVALMLGTMIAVDG
ncbi:MAG: PaaI family thioesterase [Pseudomonadota bacterium]